MLISRSRGGHAIGIPYDVHLIKINDSDIRLGLHDLDLSWLFEPPKTYHDHVHKVYGAFVMRGLRR